MPDTVTTFDIASMLPALLRIAIIVIIAVVYSWVLTLLIRRAVKVRLPDALWQTKEQAAERAGALASVLVRIMYLVVWIVASLMMLSELHVDIIPILTTVGLGAVAVGLAAQHVIRDYLNGFFILIEDWYRVGEVVVIAGTGGKVEQVNLRRTVLRDLSGTLHIFPNGKVECVSNMTRDSARINLDVSVAYKENLDHVFKVINEVGQQMLDDPNWGVDLLTVPKVERVHKLGDSGVEIKIMADTKPMQQWALAGELRRRIKNRFDEEGIEIPFPHTKVYFGDKPPGTEK
jgi:moderate conductance mechanosensitive channel